MVTSELSVHNSRVLRRQAGAFSLVEVTLALAIMAFAFLPVLGMLPTGLSVFRQAMDTSVGSQIAQRVINDAQQTDYDQLKLGKGGAPATGVNGTVVKDTRYFDDQGNEVATMAAAFYYVNTRVTPTTVMPYAASGGSAPAVATDDSLATVTVQVATNPGRQTLDLDSATNLWTGAVTGGSGNKNAVAMTTYATMVANNK